jgi:phosphoribosylformylglycinamidine synthase
LLPGVLLQNTRTKFVCKNIFLRSEKSGTILKIPIAHGEGRYYIDDKGLEKLEKNGSILYRYCTENGEITEEANPNGSIGNIAGISNPEGNVIGMMPHPERACNLNLGNLAGREIFEELFELGVLKYE